MYSLLYIGEILFHAILLVGMAEGFLNKKREIWRRICLYVGTGMVISMPMFIGDPVNIFGVLPVFCIAFLIGFEGKILSRISLALIFFPILVSNNILSGYANISFFFSYLTNLEYRMIPMIFQEMMELAVVLLFYVVLKKREVSEWEKEKRDLPNKIWYLLDILALMPVASVLVWLSLTQTEINRNANQEGVLAVLLMMPVVILSSAGILLLIHLFYRQQELEEKENMWKIQKIYYDHVEDEQLRIRRLRHDMANHLQMLMTLNQQEQAEYINTLMGTKMSGSQKRFCENKVINTVVGCKAYRMEEKEIRFESMISYPKSLAMESVELCALFGNALDNAIEACEKIEEEKERYIQIKGHAEKNLLMLQVVNSYREEPVLEKGKILTLKKEKQQHGFGLMNIQQIVDHHNGTMEVSWKDDKFTLWLTLIIQ